LCFITMEKIKWLLVKNKKIIFAVVGLFVVILVVLVSLFLILTPDQRWYMFNNPIGLKVLATWHSLRKIPNLVHLPYWFSDTKLDSYYIYISAKDANDLNSSLPLSDDGLSFGRMYEDDKSYVSVDFESPSDNYTDKVKIRYRGLVDNNWSGEKRAIRIKFPKENYFNGQKALNLIIPGDREYFSELLSWYRAKKFGLFTPSFKPVRVFINKRDFGVYYASEPWSKELLARNDYVDTNNIFSKIDKPLTPGYSVFFEENLPDWQSYTYDGDLAVPEFEELKALLVLVNNAGDEEFAQKIGALIDLEKFYYWQIINDLAGSTHQNDWENTVLLFRKETGKFEFVPWDIGIVGPNENIYKDASLLTRRILSQRVFFDRYSELLNGYVSDEKNLADDLAYYDGLYKDLKAEFYSDQAKMENDFMFNSTVKEVREMMADNFDYAKNLGNYEVYVKNKVSKFEPAAGKTAQFTGSFSRFNEIFDSADSFAEKNPQFTKTGAQTVSLSAGAHVFNKTVIIPQNLSFVIKPGAKLLFAPGISLVSYSPVTALGDLSNPISMGPLYPDSKEPWGVFAVVNSPRPNKISFLRVGGGSSDTLNGILFTSQFSIHNSDLVIGNSIFENGRSDDGAHIILGNVEIYNSVFRNNYADGIDFDYPESIVFKNNFFYDYSPEDSNGDGIDLSGVKNAVIEANDIRNYGDKCISVGEGSAPEIKNNILFGCGIGIAVKDNSRAQITGNKVLFNKTAGLDLYRKKQDWVIGGYAKVENSILWGNGQEIQKDGYSSVDIGNSVVKGGYAGGIGIETAVPDFKSILPADLWKLLQNKLNG